MKRLVYILAMVAMAGCYSNNCPVNNLVTCNYYFYDSEGEPIKYDSYITVSAILPGEKTVYVYRKIGYETIISERERPDLIKDEYTVSVRSQRNDTVLVNKSLKLQYVQVPMSYLNTTDTLLFTYSNISLPDTFYIEKESYAHVDLPECGSFRYHYIKSIRTTENAIHHVEIVNPTVNYDQEENIKIYFNGVATTE